MLTHTKAQTAQHTWKRLQVARHAAVLPLPAALLLVQVVKLGAAGDGLTVVNTRLAHLTVHLRKEGGRQTRVLSAYNGKQGEVEKVW
jgi:hypothetical protein